MFDTIKLEKGMYGVCGKNFTSILEELDPSENYKGTELDGLDAYQRQLKRFDIKVNGVGSDIVEKFFSATDSAILFPEYVTRSIKQGINSSGILENIVAAKSKTNGSDFRKLSITTSEASDSNVSEGTEMRTVTVKNNSTSTALKKHGRVLSTSYEVLRSQNLDVLSTVLKQVGKDIASEFIADAVTELRVPGSEVITSSQGGKLLYTDLIGAVEKLGNYKLTTIIANNEVLSDILNLDDVKNSAAINSSVSTGDIRPLGAVLVPVTNGGAKNVNLFDKNFALQMIEGGDIIVDYERLVSTQFENIGISARAGFAKIYNGAVKIIDYTA